MAVLLVVGGPSAVARRGVRRARAGVVGVEDDGDKVAPGSLCAEP
ncbi:hypothetical protein OG698_04885 [Streptomyces sp. NBC_01003]|nr:hypothetical protein OG698_04885 [Streptomyces sp. NBC_01003]